MAVWAVQEARMSARHGYCRLNFWRPPSPTTSPT
jgi:hypothetical protein